MLIEVTQQDIDGATHGGSNPCGDCPLARALTRTFGVPWRVGIEFAYPVRGPVDYALPPAAVAAARAFDMKTALAPFTFELPIEASNAN